MWKIIVAIVVLFVVGCWLASYGNWHLKRNRNNILPFGQLKLDHGSIYLDEAGRSWQLQPHSHNVFHQPDNTPVPVPPIPIPYPNILPPPEYEENHPNLKFLSRGTKGDSYEVIVQADGSYLLTGPKQGTYNYAHPEGFFGYTKHAFLDVLPHLFNSNYK